MTPAERLAALKTEYPPMDPDSMDVRIGETPNYLLVERSNHDGSHYLTGHASRRAAARYWSSQEFPEDWLIVKLVDLRNGDEYQPVFGVTFEEAMA